MKFRELSDFEWEVIKPPLPSRSRNGRKPRPYSIELYRKMRSAVERFFG
jgi:transposase